MLHVLHVLISFYVLKVFACVGAFCMCLKVFGFGEYSWGVRRCLNACEAFANVFMFWEIFGGLWRSFTFLEVFAVLGGLSRSLEVFGIGTNTDTSIGIDVG